jgi:hypothetical protein
MRETIIGFGNTPPDELKAEDHIDKAQAHLGWRAQEARQEGLAARTRP